MATTGSRAPETTSFHSLRIHASMGAPKPCFFLRAIALGISPFSTAIFLKMYLVCLLLILRPEGMRSTSDRDLLVQQRAPHLERDRHAHPVDLDQDVLLEVSPDCGVVDHVERVSARAGAHQLAVVAVGVGGLCCARRSFEYRPRSPLGSCIVTRMMNLSS